MVLLLWKKMFAVDKVLQRTMKFLPTLLENIMDLCNSKVNIGTIKFNISLRMVSEVFSRYSFTYTESKHQLTCMWSPASTTLVVLLASERAIIASGIVI